MANTIQQNVTDGQIGFSDSSRACYPNNTVTFLLCDWMSQVGYVICNITMLQLFLLHGHKVSFKVMESVIQCCFSLDNNSGYIKGENASQVKLIDVKINKKMKGQ